MSIKSVVMSLFEEVPVNDAASALKNFAEASAASLDSAAVSDCLRSRKGWWQERVCVCVRAVLRECKSIVLSIGN